jgi:DNA polymerase I
MKVKNKKQISVGKLDEPKLDITGFEAVRSNNAPLTQEVQRNVFYKLLTGEGEDAVIEYLKDVRRKMKEGKISLEKVAIPQGINKKLSDYKSKGPHVRGAIYANRHLDKNFGEGSQPKLIFVDRMPSNYPAPKGDGAVCFEETTDLPDDVVINWDKMVEQVVKQAVNNIFDDLGINWNRVEGQKGLGEF